MSSFYYYNDESCNVVISYKSFQNYKYKLRPCIEKGKLNRFSRIKKVPKLLS